jgi:ABC-2 type transport system permease protein
VLAAARSELRKITTIRGPWLLLAAGPLLVVAGIAGLVQSGASLHDPATQNRALAHAGLAAIFTLVFGILAVAGEYRHATITDTYLSTPRRGRVAAAKLTVYALIGAAAGLVCSATAFGVTAAWWAADGTSVQLSAADGWRTLGGGVAANIGLAAIGVGVGALVRNVVGSVALALAWVAVIEGIVGQLVGSDLARWLPFAASQALDRANITGSRLLPQWGGGFVLLAYTAIFAGAAIVTTLRRDVT